MFGEGGLEGVELLGDRARGLAPLDLIEDVVEGVDPREDRRVALLGERAQRLARSRSKAVSALTTRTASIGGGAM